MVPATVNMTKSVLIQLDEIFLNPHYTSIERCIMKSTEWHKYQRGEITQAEFVTTYNPAFLRITRSELAALSTAMIQFPDFNTLLIAKLTALNLSLGEKVKFYSAADFPKEQWQGLRCEGKLRAEYWSGHFVSSEYGYVQSDPQFWTRILAEMGQSETPQNILYIGNVEANVKCAHEFGINCVLLGKPSGSQMNSTIDGFIASGQENQVAEGEAEADKHVDK
jgi:hypothetical protein